MEGHRTEFDHLDAVAADGDHGATMVIGWRAVVAATSGMEGESPSRILSTAAGAFASVGGSIGPLWGTALLRAARALDGVEELTASDGLRALEAAVVGVAERGRSEEGDKTLLDVLGPATRELARRLEAGEDPAAALRSTSSFAAVAAERTAQLEARRGRARRVAGRSSGAVGPGAASTALVFQVVATKLVPA